MQSIGVTEAGWWSVRRQRGVFVGGGMDSGGGGGMQWLWLGLEEEYIMQQRGPSDYQVVRGGNMMSRSR